MTTDHWLRRFHPTPEATSRLVCFPHAGGSASFYFPVSRALTPSIDVVAVQYPGRQDRHGEPCLTTVADLADAIVPYVRPLDDLPLVFFGHSMGATLGFEIARRLESDGVVLAGLVVSARRAPDRYRAERSHLLDDAQLLAEIRSLHGTQARLLGDEDAVRMILPALRNDYRAAETYRYRPGPPLACPITALFGADDAKVTTDEALAWAGHTSGPFRHRAFSGGHFYLNAHTAEVMAEIRESVAPRAKR